VPDDPIGREIAQMRKDNAEDFAQVRSSINDGMAQIRGAMSGLVSRELHDAQLDRIRDQVAMVSRDLDKLVAAVNADREADKRRREDEAAATTRRREVEDDRRASDRRQVRGALIAAVLGVVVQILFATGVLP
jgi:hypothetical protein